MNRSERKHSHLFTIRIWAGETGDTQPGWRGQVEHILSGERQYFRDWDALIAFLRAAVGPPGSDGPGSGQ